MTHDGASVSHRLVKSGCLVATAVAGLLFSPHLAAPQNGSSSDEVTIIAVDTPMPPPEWAIAERSLLQINGEAAQLYADKFLDEKGFLPVTPNWGVRDGPDDLMENLRSWPLAHMLGGPDVLIELWEKAWEGHLEQVSQTKIPDVEQAREGIYYKEFTTSFDWEHISEGLGPFYYSGLSRPNDRRYEARLRRFAGFYMNEDPEAPNYDPEHKIIRSLFNGSRGPKMSPATVVDWDGPAGPDTDPNSAARMRFVDSSNIRGDHPLNMNSTMLALHAYMLTQEPKYRDWVLEYVEAWRERIEANGGNIPSNIGLEGAIGGEWGGKWYGGVFGWNSPDKGVRNYVLRGPPEAFNAALLLTGDQSYTAVLRRQFDNLFAAKKVEEGKVLLPRYFGDEGWYGYAPIGGGPNGALGNHVNVLLDIYLWELDPQDLARLPETGWAQNRPHYPDAGWVEYLRSGNPDYPLIAFQRAFEDVQRREERLRTSDRLGSNPVATSALINLTLGASDPGGSTHGPLPVNAQVRYFDPVSRRAGLPPEVAALVESIRPDGVSLKLVNTNPFQEREVVVQMGAYGEHHAIDVEASGNTTMVDAPYFTVRLAPGAGTTMTVGMRRYAHQPTLAFPWDRWWMTKSSSSQ